MAAVRKELDEEYEADRPQHSAVKGCRPGKNIQQLSALTTGPVLVTGKHWIHNASNFCKATFARSWPTTYHSLRARQGSAFSAMSVAAFGQ